MPRLKEISLSKNEKQKLSDKQKSKFLETGIDKVLVFGSSNITYLSCGMVFPYLDQKVVHPVSFFMNYKTGQKVLFCTFDLSNIPEQLDWDGDVVVYSLNQHNAETSIAAAIAPYLEDEVFIDENHTTRKQYIALNECALNATFNSADEIIGRLKLQKTEAEIRLLEIACRQGDRGFISTLNHTEGAALDNLSYPVWEYAERFRVHAGEFGGSGVGNMSVLQGKHSRELHGTCHPRAIFTDDEFIRLEYSMHNFGYWITGSRTVYVGEITEAANKAYQDNQSLKKEALTALKIGNRASDIYAAIKQASKDQNIPFWQEVDLGHGVGTSEREAPFIAPYDDTTLAENMVISLGVYTYGPDEELICDRDVYLVTENGPELLTWYKNFEQLYAMYGTSARHG